MNMSPTMTPSAVVARPQVGSLGAVAWPMYVAPGCNGHMSVNHGDTTTTESKRLTPGLLSGALT